MKRFDCLKVLAAGYRVVWTPDAELYHFESKTRGPEDTDEKQKRFKREYDMPELELSAAAKRVLLERRWSGNVRELRNTIERAVLLADGATLDASDVAEESTPTGSGGDGELPFPATIAAITQAAARRMLELCNGNKSVTARRLGISRPRLQRLLDATLDQLERDDEATDE